MMMGVRAEQAKAMFKLDEKKEVLDLTKPVWQQTDDELIATLNMISGWQCLREIGEGQDIRYALTEATKRLQGLT